MFNPDSKEFKDIDIYDFTHYLLMVGREPNENNPTLNRLIQAVKDMQKENEKGIKEAKFETPSEWGHNYSEFKGDGLGAINKLLETKKGFVAGAFHKGSKSRNGLIESPLAPNYKGKDTNPLNLDNNPNIKN